MAILDSNDSIPYTDDIENEYPIERGWFWIHFPIFVLNLKHIRTYKVDQHAKGRHGEEKVVDNWRVAAAWSNKIEVDENVVFTPELDQNQWQNKDGWHNTGSCMNEEVLPKILPLKQWSFLSLYHQILKVLLFEHLSVDFESWFFLVPLFQNAIFLGVKIFHKLFMVLVFELSTYILLMAVVIGFIFSHSLRSILAG